ncbi:hypothetical protein GUJ93_ZPchr0002g24419 [Zizania palustris]|uniref:Cytochrome b561 domain-containing protein n=1 Tax=Zizania palustris TaxID=103762 RepID=A0A8J5RV84_ZIZPA|nr:hypothetical protein GUJ93_ZPchr0002g24419 [Zizania palustris]
MMGWGVLMPLGMMAVHYFWWVDRYWFYAHMAIEVVAFVVGITTIVLGFSLNDDGLKNVNVHQALGIAILA